MVCGINIDFGDGMGDAFLNTLGVPSHESLRMGRYIAFSPCSVNSAYSLEVGRYYECMAAELADALKSDD